MLTPCAKNIIIPICLVMMAAAWSAPHVMAADSLEKFRDADFAIRTKNWDRAIGLLTEIIKVNPELSLAYHNRAVAYSKKGMYDRSLADLKRAVKLNPKAPDSYALMGIVLDIKQDYDSAVAAFQRAMKLEKRPEVKKTLARWIQDSKKRVRRK